ncbi:MAG TPA: hypothetical protein VGM90_12500 [Kofleriaceae bacterium]|jgi:hypothetical protein
MKKKPVNKKAAPKKKVALKKKPKAAPKKIAPKKRPVPKKKKAAPKKQAAASSKWLGFVKKHGVVLASAKGPVPNLAEAIVNEPIVGSWWSHPKAHLIFDVLSAIDEDVDVRCFKLVDGKVTFVHRRLWPAMVSLARAGVITAQQAESVHQEHTEGGEHRNFNIVFPDWVAEDVAAAADALSVDAAKKQLGSALS